METSFQAICWSLWRQRRGGITALALFSASVGSINALWIRGSDWQSLGSPLGYAALVVVLCATYGFFHFTEGEKKGGYGSFPKRLFTAPVRTIWLVAPPMVCGVASVIAVYSFGSLLFFRPLEIDLPWMWPCLYLATGMAWYQTVVWSLPEQRYLKLICLSGLAMALAFLWMFFSPYVIAGTLGEWGYEGDPAPVQAVLALGLVFSNAMAFGLSWLQVQRQRHGATARGPWLERARDSILDRWAAPRPPFSTAADAQFWLEWRRSGLVLPMAVAAVLTLTCVPSALAGELSGQATFGLLLWILVAPLGLAIVIGKGFSKPDFWNSSLALNSFSAVLPFSPGQSVMTKLKVAFVSVLITWLIVALTMAVWLPWAGNFATLFDWRDRIQHMYSAKARWALTGLSVVALLAMSWRFMVSSLAIAQYGRRSLFYAANSLSALGWIALVVLLIWRSDAEEHWLHLYNLWPLIEWLPGCLAILVVLKMCLAAWAWSELYRRRWIAAKSVAWYFTLWSGATGVMIALALTVSPHTVWLRCLLILLALLTIPLASPGLAPFALAKNRSG